MPWIKRNLRGTVVFARARQDGKLDVGADGRVDVKYKLDDAAKIYRAAERNLAPVEDGGPVADPTPATPATHAHSAEAIIIYTDGGAAPNPGPMGIGVVIKRGPDGRARQEIGEYLGVGTNNVAELTAIERALDALAPADREHPILLHADSSYALGVVSGEMKAKKNVELVDRIRAKARRFPHLRFVKVRGHAGVADNERCDALVGAAIAAGPRKAL